MATLTVMTWNVQNLLSVGHDDGPATQEAYEAKLAALAAVIDRVGPDVLALQEVGPEAVLADLAAACATPLPFRLVGSPDRRGIRVAFMSQRRLANHRDVTAFPPGLLPVQARDAAFDDPATPANEATTSACARGILAATLRAGSTTVAVVNGHLKSKLITYEPRPNGGGPRFNPDDEGERLRYAGYALGRRSAEAMTCRAILDQLLTKPGDPIGDRDGRGIQLPVVLCGDLNDEPQAATTQIIQGPGGSEIDLRPGSGFQSSDRFDGWRMWNLYRLLPLDGPTYTRVFRGRGELIDHIFASHRLVNPDNIPTVRIMAATPLPSMTERPPAVPTAPSDHAAVVATFRI